MTDGAFGSVNSHVDIYNKTQTENTSGSITDFTTSARRFAFKISLFTTTVCHERYVHCSIKGWDVRKHF